MNATAHDCDVLIVGAGPTGSVLALILALNGVRVLIADREAEIYAMPRAAHIDHEAMRIFQAIGLAGPISESCRQVPRYDFQTKDGEILLRFDKADAIGAGGWPAANMIHQPSIERALRAALAEVPEVDLRTSWALTALSQTADGVAATFDTPEGSHRVASRIVVGADGARSSVRELMGIGIDDLNFDEPWLVIDTIVHDAARLPAVNLQICDPARPTTCVLMGSGRHRWEFMLKPGETAEQVTDDAFVAELLKSWDVEGAISIERKAVYRFSAKVATEWRRGRVLLAGDAAHLMPPFAGQGLCSGLRDADNLGWKLAAIVSSGAPQERLLATYQPEREPHVRAIIGLAMMMGRTVCLLDPAAAAARDAQMIAARAAQPSAQGAAAWPGLTSGCVIAGSSRAGSYFAQVPADAAFTMRLDDVLGRRAWLIAREGSELPSHPAYRAIALADPAVAPFRAGLTKWLDEAGVRSVLVRPDRYVFGTGDPDVLSASYLAYVAAGVAASAVSAALDPIPTPKEKTMSLDGTYDVIVKSPMGDQKSKLTIITDGADFTGSSAGAAGISQIAGTVNGDTLTWQDKITVPMPMVLDLTATIAGDALTGTVKAGMFGSFAMTGTRAG